MFEKMRYDVDKTTAAWQKAASKLGVMWCGFMHNSPMWPIHGQYECRTCGRRYPVRWVGDGLLPMRGKLIAAEVSRSALLPLIAVLAILLPARGHATERTMVDSTDRAAMAFARYTAGLAQAGPWSLEAIEIDVRYPGSRSRGGCAPFVVCCRRGGRNIRCSNSREIRSSGSR